MWLRTFADQTMQRLIMVTVIMAQWMSTHAQQIGIKNEVVRENIRAHPKSVSELT